MQSRILQSDALTSNLRRLARWIRKAVTQQVSQPWGHSDLSIGAQLDRRAFDGPGFVYARFEDREITIGQLSDAVNRLIVALGGLGIERGDRVPVMLANHVDHIVVFFALLKLGACQVPVNVHLRGEGLRFILSHSQARAFIVDGRFAEYVDPLLPSLGFKTVIWRDRPGYGVDLANLRAHPQADAPTCPVESDDVIAISYTSGTTTRCRRVKVTDKMLRTCAHAAARLTDLQECDVLYVWEPFYHIGGSGFSCSRSKEWTTLAIVERFSVSSSGRMSARSAPLTFISLAAYWRSSSRSRRGRTIATTPRASPGAGCPVTVWTTFEERFGIRIRESYGLTEASSFTTQNLEGKIGSVGKVLPWFEVVIADEAGTALVVGQRGEIWVRERVRGVLMKDYFNNPEATVAALKDGWLRTGDVGWFDADGDYYFVGRKKDSIRRRGENITAFEIERIADEHPEIAESSAIGVANELADEDVKIFLRLKPGAMLDPLDFVRWCEGRMAHFQIPRYVEFIDAFPKTPTERIRKESLSRETSGLFDLQKSGYRLKRA
jgi:crotonobetaine/carnitine-CoA ligase